LNVPKLVFPATAFLCAAAVVTSPAQEAPGNAKCLTCHTAPGLSKRLAGGKVVSLRVDQSDLRQSAHRKQLCVDCHADMRGRPYPHKTPAVGVNCVRCHVKRNAVGAPKRSPVAQYADSVHGRAAMRGDPDAPACKDCHGTHSIRPASDPKSAISRSGVAATCGKCHGDPRLAKRRRMLVVSPYEFYSRSVHGKVVAGKSPAAGCADCHGSHTIREAADPMSDVNKKNIPATCGKCHKRILAEYEEGVHGKAAAQGVKDAPVCTDCHGEHNVQPRAAPGSSVYPTHVVATCSKCHENIRIQRRYGLPANRLSSYIGSYHGVENKFGETTVANCATCHGAHAILASSDPRSATNKKNLPRACGKCHPRAGANFAKGNIHVIPSPTGDVAVFRVRAVCRVFVAALIACLIMYIALDLISRLRKPNARERL